MTPVDQEFLHKPEIGQQGDCLRACIASLLDLPIIDVPHFAQLHDSSHDFWDAVTKFCRGQGFPYVRMRNDCLMWSDGEPIYHLISGPSPRAKGVYHAVVGCNGQPIHDPHPSKSGLAGNPSEWEFAFLVKA